MTTTLTATFDGKALLPEQPLDLKPSKRYRLKVEAELPEANDPWVIMENLIGTAPGPSDWAQNHDHYLYGTPKKEAQG